MMNSRISRWRGVKVGAAEVSASVLRISGEYTDCPSATLRMDVISVSLGVSFIRAPVAPARIVFQGDSPQLNLGASYPDGGKFDSPVCDLTSGIYRFELSPTAYTRAAYYGRKALTVSDTADFEFDFSKVSDEGGDYALVQSGGALTVTDAALAKIEAAVKKALPTAHGLYKAKLRQENNTLILRVNRQNGLILLLK